MTLLTFFCQIILCLLIFRQLFRGPCNKVAFVTMLTQCIMNYARWICATILHLSIIDGVIGSLSRMKYVLNHQYIFSNSKVAFLITFLEFSITVIVELCNICNILTQYTPINIVLNFVAVAIIAQFDEYIYAGLRNEPCKKLVECNIAEQVLIIHHTTSIRCADDELSDVKDEDGNYRLLKIKFADRDCGNKCGFITYRILRAFFVSMYFYFLPFFVIALSILIPLTYHYVTGNYPVNK